MTEETEHATNTDKLATTLETQTQFQALCVALGPDLKKLLKAVAAEQRLGKTWDWMKRLAITIAAAFFILIQFAVYANYAGAEAPINHSTVAIIELSGEISSSGVASAHNLTPMIDGLCKNTNVAGVIIHISSPGGSPSEAERIGAAIDRCRDRGKEATEQGGAEVKPKRVVAVIDGIGASAAYLVAIRADKVVADRMALVGSIGAVISKLEFGDALQRWGVETHDYASGPLKTMLSPYHSDTEQQSRAAQSIVDGAFSLFRASVEERRPTILKDYPNLYSGRVWLADEAKHMGLIDDVGVLEDVMSAEFPGLPTRVFRPRRDLHETLSLDTWMHALADAIVARTDTHWR